MFAYRPVSLLKHQLKFYRESREGEITYKGDKSIAFGVELYRLNYDGINRIFGFHELTNTVFLRNEENMEIPIKQNKVIQPILIKDTENGEEDGFLTLNDKLK